jgi:hypothetical protein
MKKLTEQQAKNCEEAREPVCRCRCNGQFHGKQRGGADAPIEFYNALPEDDPHFAPSKEQLAERRKSKLAAKRAERNARIDAAYQVASEWRMKKYEALREKNFDGANEYGKKFLEAYALYEAEQKAR